MKAPWISRSISGGFRCVYTWRPIVPKRSLRQVVDASSKQFSTSSRLRAGIAAPEINFTLREEDNGIGESGIVHARVLPESPSYFTAQPRFTDDLIQVQRLVERYHALPTVKPGESPRVAWQRLQDYRTQIGESVKASKYHKLLNMLIRLNQIHPSLMPPDVVSAIDQFKRVINPYKNIAKPSFEDRHGKSMGVGRRKSSTARAWLVEGTGEVLINGKTLSEKFGRIHDRESAIWALKATDRIDKYNVWALVAGGGTTGQAEALTLAVAKALLVHEPALKPALRRAGCVTRDMRRVERKKPGKLKARKMPAWVKR